MERVVEAPSGSYQAWARATLLAAAAVVLAGGVLAAVIANGHHATRRSANASSGGLGFRTVAPSDTSPSSPPSTATANALQAIAGYLARGAAVRPTIQRAIDAVQSCAESPSSGENALQQAIKVRQSIITGLQGINATGLPNGAQLVQDLSAASSDSMTADKDYMAWMNDFATNNTQCNSDPTQDAQFKAGQTASQQATADKNAFIALWNPLASARSEPTYKATDF